MTKIEKDAAAGAVGLVTLTLPEGLKEIGESAFQGSSKLKKVDLPASLETFGPGAFMRCKSLEEYSVATGNTHYAVQGKTLYSADLKTLVAYPEALSLLQLSQRR
ncbi:leucine-rich repeat domain-containing protein [Porphyromonas uenonis]|uniref:leucine-rich repeat domain-containing protein n=1 Tax=Porphyromonas uenonis TaxID=281920 RepID=UPI000AC0776E|nr:leucine-rich repeat domain-containing protein [Porphyromonas uenonis]